MWQQIKVNGFTLNPDHGLVVGATWAGWSVTEIAELFISHSRVKKKTSSERQFNG